MHARPSLAMKAVCPFASLILMFGCTPVNVAPTAVGANKATVLQETAQATVDGDFLEATGYDPIAEKGAGAARLAGGATPGTATATIAASRTGATSVREPAEIVTLIASTLTPTVGTMVSFSANVRGSLPITLRWHFGDGHTSDSSAASHVYDRPGSYTVTLEISNSDGTDARTMNLTVAPNDLDLCDDITELNSVFFERNSASLGDRYRGYLQENLEILEACPDLFIHIEGVSSSDEREALLLSETRARAVEQFYVDNGISANRITLVGLGAKGGQHPKVGGDNLRRADSIPVNLKCPPSDLSPFPRPVPTPTDQTTKLTEIFETWFEESGTQKVAGDVDQALQAALEAAGYPDPPLKYYAIPCGYVMATDLERIHDDGTPHENRWGGENAAPIEDWKAAIKEKGFIASITGVLADVITGPDPYRFRVMVFFVAPTPILKYVLSPGDRTATYEQVRSWMGAEGQDTLDRRTEDLMVYDPDGPGLGFDVRVYVYEFEKKAGSTDFVFVEGTDDRTLAWTHVQKSGLEEELEKELGGQ